jgi:hypothetical protein
MSIPLHGRRTAVYRLFDADDRLLYVGCTCDPWVRLDQHRGKAWWREVTDFTTTWFPDRRLALLYEAEAIAAEGPLHNINRPDPACISTPAPWVPPRRPASAMSFEQAAQDVDVPVHWLVRGVARSKLPHSCSDPNEGDVWFTPDDVRDLHIIFDLPPAGMRRQRESQRAGIYRTSRLNRCSHLPA